MKQRRDLVARLVCVTVLISISVFMFGCDEPDVLSVERTSLERSCELGLADQCYALGWHYFYGSLGIQDYEQSARFLRAACEGRVGDACSNLGQMYFGEYLGTQDLERSAIFLRQGCDLDSGIGCYGLGSLYWGGSGVPIDIEEAYRLFRRSCDLGDARGCLDTGRYDAYGMNGEIDYDLAEASFRSGCELNESEACRELGLIYTDGYAFESDPAALRQIYSELCVRSQSACYYLAVMQLEGIGGEQNTQNALEAISDACAQDIAEACLTRGEIFEAGEYTARNVRAARTAFNQACFLGNEEACGRVSE